MLRQPNVSGKHERMQVASMVAIFFRHKHSMRDIIKEHDDILMTLQVGPHLHASVHPTHAPRSQRTACNLPLWYMQVAEFLGISWPFKHPVRRAHEAHGLDQMHVGLCAASGTMEARQHAHFINRSSSSPLVASEQVFLQPHTTQRALAELSGNAAIVRHQCAKRHSSRKPSDGEHLHARPAKSLPSRLIDTGVSFSASAVCCWCLVWL